MVPRDDVSRNHPCFYGNKPIISLMDILLVLLICLLVLSLGFGLYKFTYDRKQKRLWLSGLLLALILLCFALWRYMSTIQIQF